MSYRQWIEKTMTKADVAPTLTTFVKNLSYIGLLVFVIIAALGRLGVQTTSFIAVVGAAGLAIGLALQGALANFAAGVVMIIFRPFKSGDFIDAGGAMGTVMESWISSSFITSARK
jgi:small conductance mechanosensitive channel